MHQFDSVPRQMQCCGNCNAFLGNGQSRQVKHPAGAMLTLHMGECHANAPIGVPMMVQPGLVQHPNQGATPTMAGAWPATHHANWCREWKHNPNVGVQLQKGDDNGMARQQQETGQRGGEANHNTATGKTNGIPSAGGIPRPAIIR